MEVLTDKQVKSAEVRDKPYKIADGGGLYLLVNPNSSKLWRMNYRYCKNEKIANFRCKFFLVTLLCSRKSIKLNAQQVMSIEDFKLCELAEKFLATETQLMVDNEISKKKSRLSPTSPAMCIF